MNYCMRIVLLVFLCAIQCIFINAMALEQQNHLKLEEFSYLGENSEKKQQLEECSICHEIMNISDIAILKTLPCNTFNEKAHNHTYHSICIDPWLEKSDYCPTCLTVFPSYKALLINAASIGNNNDVVALLLKVTDVNAQNNFGLTALHCAALNGHIKTVVLLLSRGANINVQNNLGLTALHCAALNGHAKLVSLLLARGANINAQDHSGLTPLHYAAMNGYEKIVHLFLLNRALANIQDNLGLIALHYAAFCGHDHTVELLLCGGANINTQDSLGNCPLHCAVINKRYTTINLLLIRDADVNARNNNGLTALELASVLAAEQHWPDREIVCIRRIFAACQKSWCALS